MNCPFDKALSRRRRALTPRRTTSIYSLSEEVVAWQTRCQHEQSRVVHEIEVSGRHPGTGWNRGVLAVVTDRLGQKPSSAWRSYGRTH